MKHIGFKKPTIKWLRWFAMTFFIGFALGSCKIEPDVVFEKPDGSDTESDSYNDAGSEAGRDSETTTVDSGSNTLESGLNGQNGMNPYSEGGIGFTSLLPWLLLPQCPDDMDDIAAATEDACQFDSSSLDLSSNEGAPIFDSIFPYSRLVDSEEDCFPSYPENSFGFLEVFRLEAFLEDLKKPPDDSWLLKPCPQICEALFSYNIGKIIAIGFISNLYYADPEDANIFHACPMTCESLRCGEFLFSQIPPLR